MSHLDRHPAPAPGCFACKVLSVNVSAKATPSRRAYDATVDERVLSRDLDAYKRLRQSGVQPPHTTGCAALEARANDPLEITHGPGTRDRLRKMKAAERTVADMGLAV